MYYEKNIEVIVGESGESKPTDVLKFTQFKEYDTGDTYYFDGTTWHKIGYNAGE